MGYKKTFVLDVPEVTVSVNYKPELSCPPVEKKIQHVSERVILL